MSKAAYWQAMEDYSCFWALPRCKEVELCEALVKEDFTSKDFKSLQM